MDIYEADVFAGLEAEDEAFGLSAGTLALLEAVTAGVAEDEAEATAIAEAEGLELSA